MSKQELLEKFLTGKATKHDFYSLGDYFEEQDYEFLGWEEFPPPPTCIYNEYLPHKRLVVLDSETGIYYGVEYYTDEEELDILDSSDFAIKVVRPLGDSWEEVK